MKNEKNVYETAKIEVLALGAEDVICASNSGSIDLPDIDLTEM